MGDILWVLCAFMWIGTIICLSVFLLNNLLFNKKVNIKIYYSVVTFNILILILGVFINIGIKKDIQDKLINNFEIVISNPKELTQETCSEIINNFSRNNLSFTNGVATLLSGDNMKIIKIEYQVKHTIFTSDEKVDLSVKETTDTVKFKVIN